MIYIFLKTITLTIILTACGGGGTSDEKVPDTEAVADVIEKAEDVVPAPKIEVPKTPDKKTKEEPKEEDPVYDNLLNLTGRKSIDFNTSGQVITVPYNAEHDAWSNNKDFSWSFVIVQDASSGSEALPIVSRGQSYYSVRVDFTNERLFFGGGDPKGSTFQASHSANLTLAELTMGH